MQFLRRKKALTSENTSRAGRGGGSKDKTSLQTKSLRIHVRAPETLSTYLPQRNYLYCHAGWHLFVCDFLLPTTVPAPRRSPYPQFSYNVPRMTYTTSSCAINCNDFQKPKVTVVKRWFISCLCNTIRLLSNTFPTYIHMMRAKQNGVASSLSWPDRRRKENLENTPPELPNRATNPSMPTKHACRYWASFVYARHCRQTVAFHPFFRAAFARPRRRHQAETREPPLRTIHEIMPWLLPTLSPSSSVIVWGSPRASSLLLATSRAAPEFMLEHGFEKSYRPPRFPTG